MYSGIEQEFLQNCGKHGNEEKKEVDPFLSNFSLLLGQKCVNHLLYYFFEPKNLTHPPVEKN